MQTFLRVAETRSFSGIARERNLSQSTVSKQIAALENRLGVRLLNRSTRSVTLTEEGAAYYEDCRAILDAVAESEAGLTRRRAAPSGLLRLACPVSFGSREIAPLLPGFLEACPELRIELVMSDRYVNLVEEGVDLAVRIGDLADADIIARRIGTTGRELVASPAYLDRAGRPEVLKDLKRHNCLVNTGLTTVDHWHFDGEGGEVSIQVSGNLSADNSEALREAVLDGLGIGLIPVWLVQDDLAAGRLEILLPDYRPLRRPIHAVYPRGRFVPAKVRHAIDMLTAAFADRPATTRG